ncbi:lipase 1-like [Gossypium australe]|uniref:Lipase 1-like n=1 Tax=Gossypium australe TaxID=47621 RepID=A0A5B6WX46_9ROSI|nr:lipase 1-like [Gossypium australe]
MEKNVKALLDTITFLVFLFFDFVDVVLCVAYKLLDELFEAKPFPCYCGEKLETKELSETLFRRKNVFRKMGFLSFGRKTCEAVKKRDDGNRGELVNRWSDCGCDSCVSWMKKSNQKLHVVVKEFPQGNSEDGPREEATTENVIFLHGFLSSSSYWTQSVFKYLSEPLNHQIYRYFAVDLLGFGKSPKPNDCLYTLNDHVEMIHKSVISAYELSSFHLVAHSMGCNIALALAAKYPKFVKSVTLVAPPYFSDSNDETSSSMALNTVARKTLWPPLAFGKSVMSWYEHVGRFFCFLICKNHTTWERIFKLFTQTRELNFMVVDLTRHTHHSAWHSMHNVICGGSKFMDDYVGILINAKVKVWVIHGDQDLTVPLDCSNNLKMKFPQLKHIIVQNVGHGTVIFHRKRDFVKNLQNIWVTS